MKIGLLDAHIYSGNHGCNALTYSAVALLNEALTRASLPHMIRLLSYSPFQGWPALLEQYPVEYQRLKFRRESWKRLQFFHNQRMICRNDICFSSVSGDSFTDIYGTERFEKILRRLFVPLNHGVPLVLLPQTIGPFQHEASKVIARKLLAQCQCVFVRDPGSRRCVEELDVKVDIRDSLDMALFMPYQQQTQTGTKHLRVGINVSGLLWNGGYTRNNMFGLKYEYPALIRDICRTLAGRENVILEFVAHVLVPGGEYAVEDDYRVCESLAEEFGGIPAPRFRDPIEAKSYLSGLDALIGSRMHCCIGAYSTGVPTFPISYSRKFTGLFEEGLNYPHVASHLAESKEVILAQVSRFIDDLPVVRKKIEDGRAGLLQIKERFLADIAEIMERVPER